MVVLVRDPRLQVQQFLEDIERNYGTHHLIFLQMSYNDALIEARKYSKYLLVYLHSDVHKDTEQFCRLVLPDIFSDIKNNNNIVFILSSPF